MGHAIGSTGKYDVLLNFFYCVMKDASDEGLAVYKDLLAELKADEANLRKAKIEDEGMKRTLKDISNSKKIRKALEEDEPPDYVKGYVDSFLSEVSAKAKAFFAELKPEPKSYFVRDRFENAIEIIASRALFQKDKRILAPDEGFYRFELSCDYRKEKRRIVITVSVQFEVGEGEAPKIGSANLTIFDGFIAALGLGKDLDKSVRFSATISEGRTLCDNTCEACWFREMEM